MGDSRIVSASFDRRLSLREFDDDDTFIKPEGLLPASTPNKGTSDAPCLFDPDDCTVKLSRAMVLEDE